MDNSERPDFSRLILVRIPLKRSREEVVRILSKTLAKEKRVIRSMVQKLPIEIISSRDEKFIVELFGRLKQAGAELLIQKSSDPEVYCSFHPINIVDSRCQKCGRSICDRCILNAKGRTLCPLCFRKEMIRALKKRTYHLFLLFLFIAFLYFVYQFLKLEEIDFFSKEPLNAFILMMVEEEKLIRDNADFFREITIGEKNSFKAIENWMREEFRRITRLDKNVLYIDLVGPVPIKRFPLSYLEERNPFLLMWDNLTIFFRLDNVAKAYGINFESYNIRLFVIFHGKGERVSHDLSRGSYKRHIGVIHLPIDMDDIPYSVITLLHELLHTVGATDKYDEKNFLAIFPYGYVEPHKDPIFPQVYGEIMAIDIPISRTMEREPKGLEEVKIGIQTAYEIGWVDEESCKRYYEAF